MEIEKMFKEAFEASNVEHRLNGQVGPLYPELEKLGFRFTDRPSQGAAYIMNDGKFLYIKDNMDLLGFDTSDFASHPLLDVFVLENGLVPEDAEINRVLCETDNAIRVNDGTNMRNEVIVGLPKVKPTEAQFDSLINWLYDLMKNHKAITVGDERTLGVFQQYHFNEYFPEDIVKKIRAYYNDGRLRETSELQHVDKTVRNALTAVPNYIYKYGRLDSWLELQARFHLTNEEVLWCLDKALQKEYINESTKEDVIEYLRLL